MPLTSVASQFRCPQISGRILVIVSGLVLEPKLRPLSRDYFRLGCTELPQAVLVLRTGSPWQKIPAHGILSGGQTAGVACSLARQMDETRRYEAAVSPWEGERETERERYRRASWWKCWYSRVLRRRGRERRNKSVPRPALAVLGPAGKRAQGPHEVWAGRTVIRRMSLKKCDD